MIGAWPGREVWLTVNQNCNGVVRSIILAKIIEKNLLKYFSPFIYLFFHQRVLQQSKNSLPLFISLCFIIYMLYNNICLLYKIHFICSYYIVLLIRSIILTKFNLTRLAIVILPMDIFSSNSRSSNN